MLTDDFRHQYAQLTGISRHTAVFVHCILTEVHALSVDLHGFTCQKASYWPQLALPSQSQHTHLITLCVLYLRQCLAHSSDTSRAQHVLAPDAEMV